MEKKVEEKNSSTCFKQKRGWRKGKKLLTYNKGKGNCTKKKNENNLFTHSKGKSWRDKKKKNCPPIPKEGD